VDLIPLLQINSIATAKNLIILQIGLVYNLGKMATTKTNGKNGNGNGNGDQMNMLGMAGPEFPDIDFGLSTNGITVTCPKLFKTTKFLPWDIRGPFTHNEVVECNYVIEADGLIIFSNRFKKGKHIKFDAPLLLRKHGNFRMCGKMLRRQEMNDASTQVPEIIMNKE